MIKEQAKLPSDSSANEHEPLPHDAFMDMLPVMLSPGKPETKEPTFTELPQDLQEYYKWQAAHRERLAREGRLATGHKIAIFASEIGSYEVEEPELHYEYEVSKGEFSEHLQAANSIEHQIMQMTGQSADVSTQLATKEAITEALNDESIAHIIFVGHASLGRLTLAVEDEGDFMWNDPEKPVDHLKLSFGVFGCSVPGRSGLTPRVGLGFVAPEGIMYGVPTGYLEEGTPYHFDQLVRLPSQDMAGTPDYEPSAA